MISQTLNKQKFDVACIGNIGWEYINIAGKHQKVIGGAGFFFSISVALFGIRQRLISQVGSEKQWLALFKLINAFFIDTSDIKQDKKSIIFYTTYNRDYSLKKIILKNEDVIDSLTKNINKFDISNSKYIHVCPLGHRQVDVLERLKKGHNILSLQIHSSNLNLRERKKMLKLLNKVDILFLNRQEANLLSGSNNLLKCGSVLSGKVPYVYITAGGEGVYLFKNGKFIVHLPAFKTKVIDTTGAGDSFAGGVIAGLVLTQDPKIAATFGLFASSLNTQGYGVNFILDFLQKRANISALS